MILAIDTSSDGVTIRLIADDLKLVRTIKKNLPARQSDELLSLLIKSFKDEKYNLTDIRLIVANSGPGSFTGIRVGLTTANFLAFSLNVPIIGHHEFEKMKPITKESRFIKLLLPVYDRPPHITSSKPGL